MLCLAFAKKSRIEDQIETQVSNQNMSMCICRIPCLAVAACTAEVAALKQDLERSEKELSLTKR